MDELLRDLVLILLAAGAVLHLFHRLRIPALVGLLVAGVLIGPNGIGIVRDSEQIDRLADVGIVLLMFSIGLDFTSERLRELLRASPLGILQMTICILLTAPLAILFVERWAEAVFLGFLVAHTSSTLLLKLLLDRGELHTPQARVGVGISITQDLSVVPMLLAVPMMARGEWAPAAFGLDMLRAILALGVAIILARWVIPFWLRHVMRARSRELFLIFITVLALGTAWATTAVGLPASLGAFLAGLAIAGSPYSDQTLSEVVPFRDLLVSLFFISIGMLLDLGAMLQYAGPALLAVVAVLGLKFLSGLVPVLVQRYPLRIAALVGLGVAQIGEFSFVLVHTGLEAGLIDGVFFQFLVLVAIVTMMLNPFLLAAGPAVTRMIDRTPFLRRFDALARPRQEAMPPPLENHVVIAGFGLNGRNLLQALQGLGVAHAVLDVDPDAVREAQARRERVFYGDCTRAEILRSVSIAAARVFVVAISDRRATRQAVQVARHESPGLLIIARTKYLAEIEPLRALGASEVIAEEFETSLEILARTLRTYNLPRLEIDRIIQTLRGGAYEPLRRSSLVLQQNQELVGQALSELAFEAVVVQPGSVAEGQTIRSLDLRSRSGATILAIEREGQVRTAPAADEPIRPKDVLILVGTAPAMREAARMLSGASGD